MKTDFTRDEIKVALAREYRTAYVVYEQLALLAKEAIHEDDQSAYDAISKRSQFRAYTLGGIRTAAAALGIPEEEFMEAVAREGGVEHEHKGA